MSLLSRVPFVGEIDKFSLEEAGYKNVVSVPGGAPECVRDRELPLQSADKAFKYLWHSQDYLQQLSCILLASDKDPPGHALAEELARRLGVTCCVGFQATTQTIRLPVRSCKDKCCSCSGFANVISDVVAAAAAAF